MDHLSARLMLLLLLLLTCLAGFSASGAEASRTMGDTAYGPFSLEIHGIDVATVGIPYGFECTAICYPGCKFSWTRNNVTTQGPELSLQLLHLVPTQILTCTVVNPATGWSASIQKTLQVTAGPSNIQISGPTYLTVGTTSLFTCSASCYPPCSYTWNVIWEGESIQTSQGSTIPVAPAARTVQFETLMCQAEDTVSHLYISTTVTLPVASVSDMSIEGDRTVTMGKDYAFTCYALCIPSCSFSWKYMGKTYHGRDTQIPIMYQGNNKKYANILEITFSDYSKIEPLTCEATNDASHATTTFTLDLRVINPISVRPTSQALPVESKSFSLQCVGSQNPTSVTWLKDKHPMPASERVHFSRDNTTITFSPLLQADDGLYQCVVAQGGPSIQSVGYQMQVNYGPSSVVISGVDLMTVGMPYEFQCSASCNPTCQFTWTRGNVISQGPKLSLQFAEPQPKQNLTCTVFNNVTGISATAQKTLQVIAGPTNIQISGPAFVIAGVVSNFTCSADCYSSCSYSWNVTFEGPEQTWADVIGLGDTISFTPLANPAISETLACTAEDTASHLYIDKALKLQVASLSDIVITGDSAVAMGKQYAYTCDATCTPSCVFTWKFMGKTFEGEQLEITISDYFKTEPLTCEATNTEFNATITATKNLTVIDPFSVQPTSKDLPIAGEAFSLQCVGPEDATSITWLKNELQMPVSERVYLSPDNTSINFKYLLRDDGGVYQCLVVESGNRTLKYSKVIIVEGGTPILSAGYLMQVNYGPDEVLIVKPNKGPVGVMMIAQPDSITELQCSTDCFPVCSINWFYHDQLFATDATISFTPVTPPYESALTCVAFNSVTKKNRTAETTVVVPDGPTNVVIEGPDALEIGVTASFKCTAECTPSCSFKWTLYGKAMTGSEIDITVSRYVSKESISCEAKNTYTGKTVTLNETLSVSDPHWCGC